MNVRVINLCLVCAEQSFNLLCVLPFSEGDAVCKPDEFARLWDRLYSSSPLYTAGGNAGPGKLGGEEVWLLFVTGTWFSALRRGSEQWVLHARLPSVPK